MPRITLPSLENETAQSIVTALVAGATTYVKPARFPKWVRRGVSMSNTLTAVGMAVAGDRRPARSQLDSSGSRASQHTVELVDGKPTSRAGANLVAATTAGMGLVTSGMAIRIDKSVEKFLLKRGVRHPRLWMAAGAAAISLASPWITAKLQESTAKLQEKAAADGTLESTLADPLGRQKTSTDSPSTPRIEPRHAAAQETPDSPTTTHATPRHAASEDTSAWVERPEEDRTDGNENREA